MPREGRRGKPYPVQEQALVARNRTLQGPMRSARKRRPREMIIVSLTGDTEFGLQAGLEKKNPFSQERGFCVDFDNSAFGDPRASLADLGGSAKADTAHRKAQYPHRRCGRLTGRPGKKEPLLAREGVLRSAVQNSLPSKRMTIIHRWTLMHLGVSVSHQSLRNRPMRIFFFPPSASGSIRYTWVDETW